MFYVFTRNFISGLYVYVRQAALSIDRAFSDDFQRELLAYYAQGQVPAVDTILVTFQKSGRRKVLPVVDFLMSGRVCFTQKECERATQALSKLQQLLSGGVEFTQAERMELRLELSQLEVLLRNKLPNALTDDIQYVEHYHQADTLELKPFRAIVGSNWPA